ncbi:MAG TPA: hypothetical protein VJX72_15340 [Candidatus Acidoferrum sp.]|nr:hypothetical protein [Candidatus Acidoferrum sp.]
MRPIKFSKKELWSLVLAIALALASVRPSDPWVYGPMLLVSWLACLVLAYYHGGQQLHRYGFVAIASIGLAFIAYRNIYTYALEVSPAEFQFINPPTPNETFTITASNKEGHSIYLVQFCLRVEDNTAKLNDFIFGIPYRSIKLVGQSKDGLRSVADILLFPCNDKAGRPLFVFFIPRLNARESRDVTITSTKRSIAVVHADPVYYDEKPHSSSMQDGDVSFDLRLSSKSGARNCQGPSLFFIEGEHGGFQRPTR